MPDAPTLESLARECFPFPPLTEAEIKLVRSIPSRGYIYIGPSSNEDDPTNDPSKADSWGSDRQIRGELIRWLCVDHRATTLFDPAGIVIMGARIIGEIDLLYVPIPFPLTFNRCKLESQLILNNATLPALDLSGSIVIFIRADGAVIKGGVLLRKGFSALGGVRMVGAEIGSTLDLSGATLMSVPNPASSEAGMALRADRLVVKGAVFMDEGFRAEGGVSFLGAQIGGDLQCDGGQFRNVSQPRMAWSGTALFASSMTVGGNIYLRNNFLAIGEVQLMNTRIGGNLNCIGSSFENPADPKLNSSGRALTADGAIVNGNVFLSDGFRASGMVKLTGIRVGLDLDCHTATFSNPCRASVESTGRALDVEHGVVGGSVYLRQSFRSSGAVVLNGIQIAGDLDCLDAAILNAPIAGAPEPSGYALAADGAIVKGSVYFRYPFVAEGEVRLPGCQIGGHIECSGGEFNCPSPPSGSGAAFYANSIQVAGDLIFGQPVPITGRGLIPMGSHILGDADLTSAQVGGDLSCMASRFNGSLRAERASVKGRLNWTLIVNPELARLDLKDASASAIVDDTRSWPPRGHIHLDGFTYQRFGSDPSVSVRDRLAWLDRMPSFSLQPYRQLAKVLTESGDNDGSVDVLVEMERRRRLSDSWTERPEDLAMKSIGYGYLPLQALGGLAALTVVGWLVYRRAYLAKAMVPTEEHAYKCYKEKDAPPPYYPRFNALVYALENVVPLVKLGQADRWQPEPEPAHHHKQLVARLRSAFTRRRLLRALLWLLIVSGWILATLFAAGFVGIVRKD